jgi:hypothetical protein
VSGSAFYTCTSVVMSPQEKFAKKLLGESEIEDVLHRMDRLTLDEARMTGTETLQIVHGLVRNMKLIMDGMQMLLCFLLISTTDWMLVPTCSSRW